MTDTIINQNGWRERHAAHKRRKMLWQVAPGEVDLLRERDSIMGNAAEFTKDASIPDTIAGEQGGPPAL